MAKKNLLPPTSPEKDKTLKEKTLESWLWDAACAIRGAQEAPKFKDFILPLVFVKRLCDVFDDEVQKMADEAGSRATALRYIERDHSLVRFYLPTRPKNIETDDTWSVIKLLTASANASIGQQLTDIVRDIARENPRIQGIIDRIDYNATTHGQRDIDDDQLLMLIGRMSEKRLGTNDVEPDIIGRSYEYLIRKFAEGGGQSAGEFYTPKEVGVLMARLLDPKPGMEVFDPNCGSAGLLVKLQLHVSERLAAEGIPPHQAPSLTLYGQELNGTTWAMANMNMVIHEMQGDIALGNSMTAPARFNHTGKGLKQFDLVTANPMWNQTTFAQEVYENDEWNRFARRFADNAPAPLPPGDSADWGWVQHIFAHLKSTGRAAIVLDTGAVSRGSGSKSKDREKELRRCFVEMDVIEGVIYLPENLFYNTTAPGVILLLNRTKPQHLRGQCILLNASREFTKGNPKNFLHDEAIERIAATYKRLYTGGAGEETDEKFALLANNTAIAANDYNLSPSRYIHTADTAEYRPIADLVEELYGTGGLVEQEQTLDAELKAVLAALGV